MYKPFAVGLDGRRRPSIVYPEIPCQTGDWLPPGGIVVMSTMPVSSPFMKSKDTAPSADRWMLVMALPMNRRPSAAGVKSVAAGDDSSVSLLLTASVAGSA